MPRSPGIEKRPNKKGGYIYYVYYHRNKKKHHIGGFKTEEEARRARESFIKRFTSERSIKEENMPVLVYKE
jgi:hypothetical protein